MRTSPTVPARRSSCPRYRGVCRHRPTRSLPADDHLLPGDVSGRIDRPRRDRRRRDRDHRPPRRRSRRPIRTIADHDDPARRSSLASRRPAVDLPIDRESGTVPTPPRRSGPPAPRRIVDDATVVGRQIQSSRSAKHSWSSRRLDQHRDTAAKAPRAMRRTCIDGRRHRIRTDARLRAADRAVRRPTNPVMQPGEPHTFSIDVPRRADLGRDACRAAALRVTRGDAFATVGLPTVVVEVVAAPVVRRRPRPTTADD